MDATRNRLGLTRDAKNTRDKDREAQLLSDWLEIIVDVINVWVYGGEKRLNGGCMVDKLVLAQDMDKGAAGQKKVCYSVVAFRDKPGQGQLAPASSGGYDLTACASMNGCAQEVDGHMGGPLSPVVPLIFYFGADEWPSCIGWRPGGIPLGAVPGGISSIVIPVAFLDDGAIARFGPDFQAVAKLCKAMRHDGGHGFRRYCRDEYYRGAELLDFFCRYMGGLGCPEYKAFLVGCGGETEAKMRTFPDEYLEKFFGGPLDGYDDIYQSGFREGQGSLYRNAERYASDADIGVWDAMGGLGFSDEEKAGYPVWKLVTAGVR